MQAFEFEKRLLDAFEAEDQYFDWGDLSYYLPYINSRIELPPEKPKVVRLTVEATSDRHVEGNWKTDLWVVLKAQFPDGVVKYFKKTGYYQSHDGEYWDGALVEVSPKRVVQTVWRDSDEYDDDSFDDSYDDSYE